MGLEDLYQVANEMEATEEDGIEHFRLLSHVYYLIFARTSKVSDIQKAVHRAENALAVTAVASEDYTDCLMDLIVMLVKKYELTVAPSDLEQAILGAEEMATQKHPDQAIREIDLLKLKTRQALQAGTRQELETVTSMLAGAVARVKEADLDLPMLVGKCRKQGGLDGLHLYMAIKKSEEELAATPHDDTKRVYLLSDMASFLCMKHRLGGSLKDLQKGSKLYAEVLTTISHDHPMRATITQNLSRSYQDSFGKTRNLADLQMAIDRRAEAVNATPNDDPDRVEKLRALATMLTTSDSSNYNLGNLQLLIETEQNGLAATSQDHPDRSAILSDLCTNLGNRFDVTGNIEDLHMAIKIGREAVEKTPPGPDRGVTLSCLAAALARRSRITKDFNDLQASISLSEEALGLYPGSDQTRAKLLHDLSISLYDRFDLIRSLDDLQRAIELNEEALPIIGDLSNLKSDSVIIFSTLAFHLYEKYRQTNDPYDWQKAIEAGEILLSTIPQGHPARPRIIGYTVLLFYTRFERTESVSYIDRILALGAEMLESSSNPRIRIKIIKWLIAVVLVPNNMMEEASHMMEIAIGLLPSLASPQMSQEDQQRIIASYSGFAVLATSITLKAGKDAYHAVRLLELGRGLIAGLRFGTRSDLTDLREQHLEMAEKFERLRDTLDLPDPSSRDLATVDTDQTYLKRINQVHRAGLEFEKTVSEIRLLPNFQNFLLPPQAEELMAAANLGPIVLINISDRCDALIVEEKSIRSIRLPNLHESDIGKYVKLLNQLRSYRSSDAIHQMFNMLEWLWDTAVGPILNDLGFLDTPSNDDWPRVWWIPTGDLSLLPLHAAGYHFPRSANANTALDRVVSSYSPSIKALIYARQNLREDNDITSISGDAVLVSMDKTPGHSDLNFAKEEISVLEGLLPGHIPRVKLERPSKQAVIERLKSCKIFHFAGHGESDPTNPSNSSLLVNDWKQNPLTVDSLVKMDLRQISPWLAYLAACSTSNNSAEDLQDEAIHLAAACQLAGFRHVVGSLWEVSDRYSVDAAREIYTTISCGKSVSLGVHRATRLLRDITSKRDGWRSTELVETVESDQETEGQTPENRDSRRVRPEGYQKSNKYGIEKSDPFVWAAYIHVGP
ncbi:hypothetical protein TWF694_008231 [Orbilia ellipsospora]|uniref:CHAT domain-containing protein n=1 Tax=Orbilia ellipsospora TaxID=2528407 RepID=A0AAV9XFG8_9PEZI